MTKIPERIVSLLPSSTEICFALGLGDRVVGVSHECDFPPEARGRTVVTSPKIDPHGSSAEIDRQVRALVADGLSIYRVDEERLRELRPDLIITQDVCEVCAVSFDEVREVTRRLLGADTAIVSLSPLTLSDVLDDIVRVGQAAFVEDTARALAASLRARLDRLRAETASLPRPRTLVLEWLSPPMIAGHWTPELIRIAGGDPILGHDGRPTGAIAWTTVTESAPDVVLIAPCGFRVEQSERELSALSALPGFAHMPAARSGRVSIADGNAFFNRPGPRLVESAEIAAAAIHPSHFADRFEIGSDALVSVAPRVRPPSLLTEMVAAALDRGTEWLFAAQRADGSWQGTNDAGPLFTGAALGFERALGVLRPEDAAAGVRYLRAAQLPDGSAEAWPFAGHGSLEATSFWYAGMRAAGIAEEDAAVVRARRAIDARGGLGGNRLIVRAFLAAAGVLDPATLPRLPMVDRLVPGMESLLGRVFGVNALIPLHTLAPMIRGLQARGTGRSTAFRPLQALEHRRVVEYLTARQDPSGSFAGVPYYTLQAALVLRLLGVAADDARIARAVAFSRSTYVTTDRGLFVGAFHCTNWDTAHMLRVLSHVPPERAEIRRALDYLLGAQSRVPSPADWQTPPPGAPRTGGWAWQPGNVLNPDIDSTAEVLSALALYPRRGAAAQPGLDEAIRIGAAFLMAMQNPDGGWAAFSHGKRSAPPGPLYVRRGEPPPRGLTGRVRAERQRLSRWLAENGDPSTADVTGRVLYGLGSLGYQRTDPRIARAIEFLERHELPRGAWWGRWSVNYLPSTSYVVTGLLAVGEDPASPRIRRALSWLLSRQNPDGGWGETTDSYVDPDLAGHGSSSVQVTGVVTWALARAGEGRSTAVERGVRYLLARQRAAGDWEDHACYGTVFPHLHYYYTDTFPTYFAMEALHAYRSIVS